MKIIWPGASLFEDEKNSGKKIGINHIWWVLKLN